MSEVMWDEMESVTSRVMYRVLDLKQRQYET